MPRFFVILAVTVGLTVGVGVLLRSPDGPGSPASSRATTALDAADDGQTGTAQTEPRTATSAPHAVDDYAMECFRQHLKGLRLDADGESPDNRESVLRDAAQAMDTLRESSDPDHRLAAYLLTARDENGELSVADMQAFFADPPDTPVALWTLLQHCLVHTDEAICADSDLTAQVRRLDPQNTEAWAMIAAFRVERGQTKEALSALTRAGSSTRTDDYSAAYLWLGMRALAAAGVGNTTERAMISFGLLAAMSGDSRMIRTCMHQAPDSLQWRDACRTYGMRLERLSRTKIRMINGLVLQQRMAELDMDFDRAAQFEQRRLEISSPAHPVVSELMIGDDEILMDYLEVFAAENELAAIRLVEDEVIKRIQESGVDDCEY